MGDNDVEYVPENKEVPGKQRVCTRFDSMGGFEPVMRETGRRILEGRTVIIQCANRARNTHAGSFFCSGVARVELPENKTAGWSKCEDCGFPMSAIILPDGMYRAYVPVR